jgi:glycosyltransferase involved in cell wall biosynthesis
MEKRHIVFIYKRFSHHATHSGYDQLTKHIAGEILAEESSPAQVSLFEKYVRRINQSIPYKPMAFALEIEAIISMLRQESCIYHVLYMEHSYQFLGYFNPLQRHKIVGTFHEPPNLLHKLFKAKDALRQPAAVIALSRDLAGYLREVIRHPNVFFVPYGVDTCFFAPQEVQRTDERKNCIVVGEHLRDFELLQGVIKAFESQINVRFKLVIPKLRHQLFGVFKNVELYNGISDEDLRDCYCRSNLMLLPLKNCVANTALLEAMACGLPIVATSVGGIRDYLDEKCAYLVPKKDVSSMVEAVRILLNDEDMMHRMGSFSRKKALEFDWTKIAEQTRNVYASITG